MKKKTTNKFSKAAGTFASILLETISDLAELAPRPFEGKGEYQKRIWNSIQGSSRMKISQGIYRLERQGLIRKAGKQAYCLTVAGENKLLINRLKLEKKPANSSWVVLFDFPEEFRNHRKFLRRTLLLNGFVNLRKSAMIGRYDLTKDFFRLLENLGIRKFVSVVEGRVRY